MLPVPQVPGHCKHLSGSQHRLEFPDRRQTPEGLRSNTSGPGQGPMGPCGAHVGAILTYLDQTCCRVPPLLKVLLTVLLLNFQCKARPQNALQVTGVRQCPGTRAPPPCLHTPGPTFSSLPPAPSHQETDWGLQSGRAHSVHIWAQRLRSFPVCLHCNEQGVRPRVSKKNTWTAAPPAPPRPAQLHGEG